MTSLPFLVLDLGLDIIYGVRGLDLECDGFAREAVAEGFKIVCSPRVTELTSLRKFAS